MPKMPNKQQLEKMHEIANKTLDPVEVLEGLLNDVPELKDLQQRLIDEGIVQEVDEQGNPV